MEHARRLVGTQGPKAPHDLRGAFANAPLDAPNLEMAPRCVGRDALGDRPAKLEPQPRCLDEPPKFFARQGAAADSAEEAVRLWAWAWASRKADTVVQMYSADFQATGEGGAAAFIEQRRQQVETGRAPEPKLEDVTVTASGADRRVVTFVQRFGEGAVRKEMVLVREGGLWRIVSERTLEVL